MEKKKYVITIVSLILSVVLYGIIFVLGEMAKNYGAGFIPREYVSNFVVILPGPLWSDIILLYILPVLSFLIVFLIAPIIIHLYLKIHQVSTKIGTKTYYGIVEVGDKVGPWKLFRRAFIVSLFSFSISALIVAAGQGRLFRENIIDDIILNEAEAVFLGTFFLSFIIIIIFLPIWYLEDAGIVGYKYNAEKRMPPKIVGISSLYSSILEGYAGISTIFILITYIIQCLNFLIQIGGTIFQAALLTPLILIILPFIITGLFAIPLFLYEQTLGTSVKRIHKRLKKLNFVRVPEFDEVKYDRGQPRVV